MEPSAFLKSVVGLDDATACRELARYVHALCGGGTRLMVAREYNSSGSVGLYAATVGNAHGVGAVAAGTSERVALEVLVRGLKDFRPSPVD